MTASAPRAYVIADAFRARGIPVVMGGIHPTVRPDEAAGARGRRRRGGSRTGVAGGPRRPRRGSPETRYGARAMPIWPASRVLAASCSRCTATSPPTSCRPPAAARTPAPSARSARSPAGSTVFGPSRKWWKKCARWADGWGSWTTTSPVTPPRERTLRGPHSAQVALGRAGRSEPGQGSGTDVPRPPQRMPCPLHGSRIALSGELAGHPQEAPTWAST